MTIIFSPAGIAEPFLETFDRSAIELFRRFLARHPHVRKWIIAADFSQHNDRPLDCFAFTILPYDAWPAEIERDVREALPGDLKKSKDLDDEAVEWWYDYMIRASDWIAGAVAAWDRKRNLVPADQPKYRHMLEDVITPADNIVLLHLDLTESGIQFRRIAAKRKNWFMLAVTFFPILRGVSVNGLAPNLEFSSTFLARPAAPDQVLARRVIRSLDPAGYDPSRKIIMYPSPREIPQRICKLAMSFPEVDDLPPTSHFVAAAR